MGSLEPFKIDLKGLKEGDTELVFHLDDSYFEAIDAPEVQRGELRTDLSIHRVGDFFELNFHTFGTIQVPCDRCLEPMAQAIDTQNKLVVKFGEDYVEDDDLVTVPENEGVVDVSWFVYEFVELSIPFKHAHAPGECDPAMLKLLEAHSTTENANEDDSKDTIDPRWAGLEKIKTTIKE
uniref:DUF177 domain-containing protein n=3 Tax=unclassified Prevotella TaxID=2638335 RepID=A0AB33JN55_9BACT